jgi:hypothetical protein
MAVVRRAVLLAVVLLVGGHAAHARAEDPAPAPAAQAKPAPFLWLIEGPPRIYLFGTIHLPDPRVMDFPPVVREAHASADVVWGELGLGDAESPRVQASMYLSGGKRLEDVVPEATYAKLQAYLQARGTPSAIVDRMKPLWAALVVGMLDALPLLASGMPMDKLLLKQAQEAGRETGGLETIEEQLEVFDAASLEAQAQLLDEAVVELEKARVSGKKPLEELIAGYVKGDLTLLHDELAKMSATENPEAKALAKRLLDDRNVKMVQRILERSARAPEKTYFVLVGAGHYAGPEGILALLAKQGVKARRLAADERLPARAPVQAPAAR